MASTPADRFVEAQRVYRDAFNKRAEDLKEATTEAQVSKIIKNVEKAELAYLRAGRSLLEGNNTAIDDAYKAAKAANDEVAKARQAQQNLAEKIRKVASAITLVGKLIDLAS